MTHLTDLEEISSYCSFCVTVSLFLALGSLARLDSTLPQQRNLSSLFITTDSASGALCFARSSDKRMVVGTLRGFDQFMNLVVDNTEEVNGNERNEIGMVVIRGNSVVTVEALEPVRGL
ncbi:hypothetical protein KSS87_000853 [Heliosperma pusillum]|nr:hypothetical protein KSS87_000853 [Heliosperma pusillum]